MLKYTFDQDATLKIINDIFSNKEPGIKDIEQEFYSNCPDLKDVNMVCNIYRERFKKYLFEFDYESYLWEDFAIGYGSSKHPLYNRFKALRETGLITVSIMELECKLGHIIQHYNRTVDLIIQFFEKMRLSTINTVDLAEPKLDSSSVLKKALSEYGFLQLEKVARLNNPDKLIEILSNSAVPYLVSMLNHIDFIKHIQENYANGLIGKRNNIIATITGKSVDSIKNNINFLDKLDPNDRYTASIHKETVKNDYNDL
jgi:hypothetical protein